MKKYIFKLVYLLIFDILTLREAVRFKQYIYKDLSVQSLIKNTAYPSPTTTHLMASIAPL